MDRIATLRSRIDRLRVERAEAEASLAAIMIALSVTIGELFELLDSDEYLLASDPAERRSFEAPSHASTPDSGSRSPWMISDRLARLIALAGAADRGLAKRWT